MAWSLTCSKRYRSWTASCKKPAVSTNKKPGLVPGFLFFGVQAMLNGVEKTQSFGDILNVYEAAVGVPFQGTNLAKRGDRRL